MSNCWPLVSFVAARGLSASCKAMPKSFKTDCLFIAHRKNNESYKNANKE